jgi:2-polyprenyl-6-methoxyphenol hydroxylase-like FAD-dependent oxidoreductase
MYDDLVNVLRAQVTEPATFLQGKVTDISTGPERQTVTLASGDQISARLVVIASGLNVGLQHKLGIEREVISAEHSISIGFDAAPVDRPAFPFEAMTYYSERPRDMMAYITLFAIGTKMRANLFGYRSLRDPWIGEFRDAPQETLFRLWPGLQKLTGDFSTGSIKVRPIDLYVTHGHRRDGLVLVGDAFATSCPAAGTGARKALVDVERLCNVHIPRWLVSPGMGSEKIAAYYEDRVKRSSDAYSELKAFQLRSVSTDPSLSWAARRWTRFGVQWARVMSRHATTAAAIPSEPVPENSGELRGA